jgi:protein SCO1/2
VRRTVVVAVALVVAALTLAGCGSKDTSFSGDRLENTWPASPIELTDTSGAPYSLAKSTEDHKLTLVFFGYTHCPDICQVVMSTIASAVSRLDTAQGKQVQVVFVTTDPARDTGPVLRTYLDRLDPDFVGLTGKLQRIVDLATPLKVYIEKGDKLPSGGYDVTHTTEVFGVTGDKARIAWGQDTSPAELKADIIKLLAS